MSENERKMMEYEMYESVFWKLVFGSMHREKQNILNIQKTCFPLILCCQQTKEEVFSMAHLVSVHLSDSNHYR